jgi:hypothetical protein
MIGKYAGGSLGLAPNVHESYANFLMIMGVFWKEPRLRCVVAPSNIPNSAKGGAIVMADLSLFNHDTSPLHCQMPS